ncbi:carboxylesterase family protein [Pseudonocardia ailaonensis]|uniref:Carboxylic ester hydrolase n=1 Tax=Pseudonocardia ailaonensis TaxID=367279 RepID=A0ABN2MSA3_9PSEU
MTRVRTEYGTVEGLLDDGVHLFRALPYAAPPFGRNRFRAPQPPEPWDGVRDATRPGVAPPQPSDPNPMTALYAAPETGEDCLTLEVTTPDPGARGLPVLVHFHGGGFVFGAGSLPGYRGHSFARSGVVHVGVNYRLGIDGFLHVDGAADNRGLRDQTAALEWVQRNISAFGGDPSNVTVFGQSGGAVATFDQLAMPASRGLFARAIAQSGHPAATVDADEARKVTRQVARMLRVAPTVEGLSGVSLPRTAEATRKALERFALGLLVGRRAPLLISPFRGVHDTETLPSVPGTADVPVLAGTTRNEMIGLTAAIADVAGPLAPMLRRGIGRAVRVDGALRAVYRGTRGITDHASLVEAAWTDWGFRIPTLRFAESRPAPTWIYEFRWQPDTLPPLRHAAHGLELPFVRDDLDLLTTGGAAARELFGPEPPKELAGEMHSTWVRFASTGDPGWARYEPSARTTMVFDAVSAAVSDAAGPERTAWDGRPVHGL